MTVSKKRELLVAQFGEHLAFIDKSFEYVESDIKTLFSDVLRYVPELKKIINNVKDYSHKHLSST